MKALVLGLGVSGKSVFHLLKKEGWDVVGIDDSSGSNAQINLKEFDLFVPSPGVPRSHPLYVEAKNLGMKIAGEAQIAMERISARCIGVTGTNGKTTVVKMIEHCLKACGKNAKAVGNMGPPLCDFTDAEEILVVELSSFQLETLKEKAFEVGVILNISEDHLDRYESFEEYAKTKKRLKECVAEGGKFFEGNFKSNEEVARLVCAQFGVNEKAFFEAVKSFEKPPHRLEFVGEIDGVFYFNDSKATNVAAMLRALDEMDRKVVLLAGGKDKGLSFEPLGSFREKLKSVVAFGEARFKIADAVKNEMDVHLVESLDEAIEKAKQLATNGQAVLLSPGCTSFDAFKNYEERGDKFKMGVKK